MKRTVTFSFNISTLFVLLLSIVTTILISFNYYKSYSSSYQLLERVQKEMSANIVNTTTKFLDQSATQLKVLSKLSHTQTDIKNKTNFVNVMWEQLKIETHLKSIFIGDSFGNFLQVRRDPELALRIVKEIKDGEFLEKWDYKDENFNTTYSQEYTSDYDARKRPWYIGANDVENVTWSRPYIFAYSGDVGITVSYPLFDAKGGKKIVFAADVTSTTINAFLKKQSQKIHGEILIFDDTHSVLASSMVDNITKDTTEITKLENFVQSDIVMKATQKYKTSKSGVVENKDGVKFIYFFYQFPDEFRQKWEILTLIPQEQIIGSIQNTMYDTIMISFLIMIVFIVIILYISKKVSRPITKLSEQIHSIEQLELNIDIKNDSNIKEIHEAQNSLKSLQVAIGSFIKYIPIDLVKRFIKMGEEVKVGGREKDLAIMFTDLEGFTSISEHMKPREIATQLSEYFDTLDRIIIHHEGTIDKYIGDAILAFWGAPLDVEDPITKAVESALAIQRVMVAINKVRLLEGKAEFKTRIGIHYGKALVGNIGSNDRLNYTVIGDNVNVTARLEKINKEYGTYIAISDVVYEHIKGKYETQYVDSIQLKGKEELTRIYTLKY